jgi:subtilisin family serine protease
MSKDYEGNPDVSSITPDGIHLAWAGTSAAAPYVAGVVALMLQKNPALDAAQVKEILTKSVAPADDFTGALPNTQWGYGKIDPQAALKATPAARPVAKPR